METVAQKEKEERLPKHISGTNINNKEFAHTQQR